MANEEHLKIIKQGVDAWNAWRRNEFRGEPDLSDLYLVFADLSEANLTEADLHGSNLTGAQLREANLSYADLSEANLSRALLIGAQLNEANLRGTNFSGANLVEANLIEANLGEAILRGANLSEANLSGANLIGEAKLSGTNLSKAHLIRANLNVANLRGTNLIGANLSGATLSEAILYGSDLSWADLSGADLTEADLSYAHLRETNLSNAFIGHTTFGNNDLSTVKGLDTVIHAGPSTIGVDTLFRSDGKIPEVFLRGAGVPEDFVTFVPSLVGRAIEFYSCFISFSHHDEAFSQRLHSRMRAENLRVWYAPEDMKGGRKLHEEIFRAIQIHDKLLLVLSESSMKSEWVITEIRRARKVEQEEKRRKLFPIRLVDFEAIQKWECFDADTKKDLAIEVREYYIPDFSNWKDHDGFETEFAKLLRDLRATKK